MSSWAPRYNIGRLDRIRIDEIAYEHVETDQSGHILQRVEGHGHSEHFTHDHFAELHSSGRLAIDSNHFSPARAKLQQSHLAEPLCDLSPKRQIGFLRQFEFVRQFREGYQQGRFNRSSAGFSVAAKEIYADIRRDQREAALKAMEEAEAQEAEEADIQRALRRAGYRKNMGRHDSPSRPPPPPQLDILGPLPPVGRSLAGWVLRYEKSGCDPASLRDRYGNCGRRSKLDPEVQRIIETSLNEYLTERRPTIRHCYRCFLVDLAKENEERARRGQKALKEPSYKSYRNFINRIPAFERLRSRNGSEAAAAKFAMSSGGIVARYPMQRLEIDEWSIQVHVINGEVVPKSALSRTGKHEHDLVRLHLAAVIDCATRYVVGIHFSRTASPANVKAALRMALSDKSEIARAVGAKTPWGPHGGLMEIYSDTGPSFDSSFKSAVQGLEGNYVAGPAKKSDLRPIIERWFHTLDQTLLPHFTGRTFSNTIELGAYPAEARASATVAQFTRNTILEIVDVYHNTGHSGLRGQTPHEAWQQGVRDFGLPPPPDLNRLRVNLGDRHERKTSGEGVTFSNVPYNSLELQAFRRRHGDKYVAIAVDPNNINHISVRLDEGWHVLKSPSSVNLRGISLQAWRAQCQDLRRHFADQAALAEETVRAAIERIRSDNREAVLLAGLVGVQPNAAEIERDEGKLRIGWTEPQQLPSQLTLADADLDEVGEFIPFTGPKADMPASEETPNDPAGGTEAGSVATPPAPAPSEPVRDSNPSTSWLSDDDGDWTTGDSNVE